jgi:hypothetical protein
MVIIPVILSTYTHFWNPLGFPAFHNDEGEYLARSMHVLVGLGFQDQSFYDHPYFGQLFLGSIFWLIDYPHSLHPSVWDMQTVEALYMIPRMLMGFLAVVDTLLIYKISEHHYNRNVAFIASILFAVMPITWLTRRIFLDSIQLPFLLSSILMSDYAKNSNNKKKTVLTLLSGTCLGLAIFTKLPAFTMIPLVAFLIHNKTKNQRVLLAVWLIPVILIPMIWPAYALSIGEFHQWIAGVSLQLHRISQPLVDSINAFFKDDPILLLLGAAGMAFAAIKRDYFLLLWVIPFLIFLYYLGYVSLFYFIPLLPPLCIAAARLVEYLPKKIKNKEVQQVLPFAVISGIAIFGLVSISMLLTTDLNSSHFKAATFVVRYLPHTDNSQFKNDKVTIISDPFYSWIPQYVFGKNEDYLSYDSKQPPMTNRILLVVDWGFINAMLGHDKHAVLLQNNYNKTHNILSIVEEARKYDFNMYPYTNLAEHPMEQRILIRTNY